MDKAPPEKNESEKKLLIIEAHTSIHKILNYFWKNPTIESQDTNRYTILKQFSRWRLDRHVCVDSLYYNYYIYIRNIRNEVYMYTYIYIYILYDVFGDDLARSGLDLVISWIFGLQATVPSCWDRGGGPSEVFAAYLHVAQRKRWRYLLNTTGKTCC